MKVSSPVGEFPFELKGVSVHGTRLHLDGAMGAWPSHVEIGADDVPALLRVAGVGPRTCVVAAIAAGALLLRRRAR